MRTANETYRDNANNVNENDFNVNDVNANRQAPFTQDQITDAENELAAAARDVRQFTRSTRSRRLRRSRQLQHKKSKR